MTAAEHPGGTPDTPPGVPAHMAELVARAAAVLKMHWPCTGADFDWWAAGEDCGYHAKLEWPQGVLLPRVVVFDRRSGYFVCQSQEGQLYEIDPSDWVGDRPSDEIDRHLWAEEQSRKRGGKQ